MANANDILTAAKTRLLLLSPFFGSLICKRPPILRKDIPTAGVDARGKLYVNPEFVESLDVDQVTFLLAHETMHVVWQHALREGERDHKVWNIAADAVINQLLMEQKIGTFIEGGVDMPEYAGWDTESVYNDLLKNQDKTDGYKEESDPLANDVDSSGAGDMSEGEKREVEGEIKQAVGEASTVAKMQGSLKGSLARMVEAALAVKTPWYEILEQYMVGLASQEQSWKRPNRRYARMAYLPSMASAPSMGGLVVGIDTSGSITSEDLSKFLGHINAIAEQVHPEWIKVVYCDCEVSRVDEYEPDDFPLKASEVDGCGGTDMGAVTRWIEDEGLEPDVCIIFTDGYTPYPDDVPCDTVWAITSGQVAPEECGVTLHVED